MNDRPTTITIVGSRKLQIMPVVVIDFLQQLPIDALILLRSGNISRPGRFERIVAKCCSELWMSHEWVKPELGDRGATFDRDVAMVGRSDCVLAFFAEEHMSGGTEHVVEKAIDQRVPVYSYGMRDGALIRIGEEDPMNAWVRLAPAV
jgi:hypothetical protein